MPEQIAYNQRLHRHQQNGKAIAQALLAKLYHEIEILALQSTNPESKMLLKRCVAMDIKSFELNDAAAACDIIGMDLAEFIRRVTSR